MISTVPFREHSLHRVVKSKSGKIPRLVLSPGRLGGMITVSFHSFSMLNSLTLVAAGVEIAGEGNSIEELVGADVWVDAELCRLRKRPSVSIFVLAP